MKEETLKFIVDNAISREIEAYQLYLGLQDKMSNPDQKLTFKNLAAQELEHKKLLETLDMSKIEQQEGIFVKSEFNPINYVVVLHEKSTLLDIIEFAINKEHEAFTHYRDLSETLMMGNLKKLFAFLAGQELGHMRILEHLRNILLQDKSKPKNKI